MSVMVNAGLECMLAGCTCNPPLSCCAGAYIGLGYSLCCLVGGLLSYDLRHEVGAGAIIASPCAPGC